MFDNGVVPISVLMTVFADVVVVVPSFVSQTRPVDNSRTVITAVQMYTMGILIPTKYFFMSSSTDEKNG